MANEGFLVSAISPYSLDGISEYLSRMLLFKGSALCYPFCVNVRVLSLIAKESLVREVGHRVASSDFFLSSS